MTPVSTFWCKILTDDFALYQRLPLDLQTRLEGHINIFLHEKLIFGGNGQEVTDQVRVLIAAQACLLILNKVTDYYPDFRKTLVYPETYMTKIIRQDGMLRSQSVDVLAGKSWHRGPVVLAWTQVLQDAIDGRNGHNIVMREFAHNLDQENSIMDGLPVFSDAPQYPGWARVLNKEYKQQQQKMRDGEVDVIDSYAAGSPAEFFTVVTETFFEKSRQLKKNHPNLYEQLQVFYQLDPVVWDFRKEAF